MENKASHLHFPPNRSSATIDIMINSVTVSLMQEGYTSTFTLQHDYFCDVIPPSLRHGDVKQGTLSNLLKAAPSLGTNAKLEKTDGEYFDHGRNDT